jgi:hypothetical protein
MAKDFQKATSDHLKHRVREIRELTGLPFSVVYGPVKGHGTKAWLELNDKLFGRKKGYKPPPLVKFLEGFLAALEWKKENALADR